MKELYFIFTSPLGLPVNPLWEYVGLLVVGEVVHLIAWNVSPRGNFGSAIYWITKFLAFLVIWAILYGVIVAAKFVVAHWRWFSLGAAAAAVLGVVTWVLMRKRIKVKL